MSRGHWRLQQTQDEVSDKSVSGEEVAKLPGRGAIDSLGPRNAEVG